MQVIGILKLSFRSRVKSIFSHSKNMNMDVYLEVFLECLSGIFIDFFSVFGVFQKI